MSVMDADETLWVRYWKRRTLENRNALVERHLRLVYLVAKRYTRNCTPMSRENEQALLVSAAIPRLIRAVELYRPDFHCEFATYALSAIRRQMQTACSREARYRQRYKQAVTAAGSSYLHELCTISDTDEERQGWPLLYRLIRPHLDHDELKIIQAIFWHDRTLREIGEAQSVSRQRIFQIKQEAMAKLRDVPRLRQLYAELY
jgi:RNA polymerase sigma factor (sigma-70 family)